MAESTEERIERYHSDNKARWIALEEKVDEIASVLRAIQMSANFTKWFVSVSASLAAIGAFLWSIFHAKS